MENSSIGIIGGADGPTSVIVSTTPVLPIVLCVAAVLVVVIIAAAVIGSRK